jgi:hypothetical protein
MNGTRVETEVRFVWLTNGKAGVWNDKCTRKGPFCPPRAKTPVDPSMTITRHTPSIGLRHTGWLREAAASSRLIAKSARQFEGHGADRLSGTSAKSGYFHKEQGHVYPKNGTFERGYRRRVYFGSRETVGALSRSVAVGLCQRCEVSKGMECCWEHSENAKAGRASCERCLAFSLSG